MPKKPPYEPLDVFFWIAMGLMAFLIFLCYKSVPASAGSLTWI